MNNTIINVSAAFLKKNKMIISWQELLWGMENGYIKSEEIVLYALDLLEKIDSNDSILIQLCGLSKNEFYRVKELVVELATNERLETKQEIASNWLYIILFWLFENKEQFADPLEIVEMIYADFDYPESMASFIRYMPSNESTELYHDNIDRLMKNWEVFVKSGDVSK